MQGWLLNFDVVRVSLIEVYHFILVVVRLVGFLLFGREGLSKLLVQLCYLTACVFDAVSAYFDYQLLVGVSLVGCHRIIDFKFRQSGMDYYAG